MAGAGGLFILLVAAVIGLGAAAAGVGLVFFGSRSPRAGWRLALAIVMIVFSSLATLVSLPAWIVLFTGKSTRGEPLDSSDLVWISALLLPPPATIAALTWWLVRKPRAPAG